MEPAMTRFQFMMLTALLVLAGAAAWVWLRPAIPVSTPYFRWHSNAEQRYELIVHHVEGNPEFRQGVTTTPVPQSGALRIEGKAGSAEPGAMVEVSNPRTGQGYATTADATGAFAVTAEVRRGDTLKVISRQLRFRPTSAPVYSSAVVSSP
jgi:hypothetical protein